MSIPTTNNVRERLTPDEMARFEKVGKALSGIPADRAVAMLMAVICEIVDQTGFTEVWRAIERGAKEEIRLLSRRGK